MQILPLKEWGLWVHSLVRRLPVGNGKYDKKGVISI